MTMKIKEMKSEIWLWLSTIISVIIHGYVSAQAENTNHSTLYVRIENLAGDVESVQDFTRDFQSRLKAEDINMVIVDTEDDMAINFVYLPSGAVLIRPTNTHKLSVSPMLHGSFDVMSTFDLNENRMRSQALDFAAGVSLYVLGDCGSASKYFQAISIKDDGSRRYTQSSVAFYQANCALIRDDFEAARMYYESALEISDEDLYLFANTVTNAAWTYLQLGMNDKAFNLMEKAVQSEPDCVLWNTLCNRVDILTARAQLYALAFRFDDAIVDMNAAIDIMPDNPRLYVQRGQIVMLLYEWDRVLENYDRALALDPDYVDAYFYRGVLYYSLLEREQALADFQQYLEFAPAGELAVEAKENIASIQLELDALSN